MSRKKSIPVEKSIAEWRRDPAYAKAYDDLEDEFALAAALIDARGQAGFSQADMARKMQTSQPAIARLEGGRANPSIGTLRRFAKVTGTRLKIAFEPIKRSRAR
jgi:ribosome-binding protein aMBF1 (putative translation factor)